MHEVRKIIFFLFEKKEIAQGTRWPKAGYSSLKKLIYRFTTFTQFICIRRESRKYFKTKILTVRQAGDYDQQNDENKTSHNDFVSSPNNKTVARYSSRHQFIVFCDAHLTAQYN